MTDDSAGAGGHGPGDSREIAYVTVHDGDETDLLVAPVGATLRDVLLAHGHSPYTRLTRRANCGGRGLCATCGVRVAGDVPAEHWHDRLADRFGYPRLSCQLSVAGDLAVEIPEKRVWGGRERDPVVGGGDAGEAGEKRAADPGAKRGETGQEGADDDPGPTAGGAPRG